MPTIGFTKSNTDGNANAESKGFVKGEGFSVIPDGSILPARVFDMRYRKVNKEKTPWKKWDDEIAFTFKLTEDAGEYRNRRFWAETPFYLDESSGCRLRLWLESIVGIKPLPDDFEFDTDDLESYIGFDCLIKLDTYEVKNGENKGQMKNGVADVLPTPTTANYDDVDEIF